MSEENEVINNQEDSLEINSLKQEIENQKAELDERKNKNYFDYSSYYCNSSFVVINISGFGKRNY